MLSWKDMTEEIAACLTSSVKICLPKIKLDVHLKGLWSVWDGMGWGGWFELGLLYLYLVGFVFSFSSILNSLPLRFPRFQVAAASSKTRNPRKVVKWSLPELPCGQSRAGQSWAVQRGPLSSTEARLTLKIPPEEQPSADRSHIHLISKPWCDIWNTKKVTTKINVSK